MNGATSKYGDLTKWLIEDGTMHMVSAGGNIITKEKFTDFELKMEWKISEGGNSGSSSRLLKLITNHENGTGNAGLDNEKHPNGKWPKTSAGAIYGLLSHPKKPLNQRPMESGPSCVKELISLLSSMALKRLISIPLHRNGATS